MKNEIAKRYRLCSNCSDRILSRRCDGKCKEYWKYVGATEQKAREIEKACNIFCHVGCPHKTDSYDCLKDKCDAWKRFRRMVEEWLWNSKTIQPKS